MLEFKVFFEIAGSAIGLDCSNYILKTMDYVIFVDVVKVVVYSFFLF